MGMHGDDKCVFPLTSLQIGDLQSYLSDLSLFLAIESNKLYILVDNRPWLRDLVSGPAHLWQLMVTKSRLSPFANTKAQRRRKQGDKCSQPGPCKSKKYERWFPLIDAATLSKKRVLLPVKKIKNSLIFSNELHHTLYGFIVFEVAWTDVRGINYLNELQTDTSLALEAKIMFRWEFDSIQQAASSMPLWFSGTPLEHQQLKDYLDSLTGEVFYDAEENFPKTLCFDEDDDDGISAEEDSAETSCGTWSLYPGVLENRTDEPHTPPTTGPYKRRKLMKSTSNGAEVQFYTEETQDGIKYSLSCSGSYGSDCENNTEAKQYRDVLILFRFNDRDLPFKLKEIIMSDLRLLTLLEAGLPSWAIFLQSYPGFCNIYRPWMCPLARVLYVLMSIVTVLIGFYDLYKNVPVLKATVFHLCGPLFDWIESWDMVSRIKYLGTMLFLHNFEKAVTWFLTVTRTTRSFFSVLTRPLMGPLVEFIGFLLPTWNVLIQAVGGLFSIVYIVVESTCSVLGDLVELILWPLWSFLSLIWTIASTVLYPVIWLIWETLYAPIRLARNVASLLALIFVSLWDVVRDFWQSVSGILRLASVSSEVKASTYQVSMWRSLWNDLFSQVFRAIRSILNGFVAFFAACNRHRLSIYNHFRDFIRRVLAGGRASQSPASRNRSSIQGSQNSPDVIRRIHTRESSSSLSYKADTARAH